MFFWLSATLLGVRGTGRYEIQLGRRVGSRSFGIMSRNGRGLWGDCMSFAFVSVVVAFWVAFVGSGRVGAVDRFWA